MTSPCVPNLVVLATRGGNGEGRGKGGEGGRITSCPQFSSVGDEGRRRGGEGKGGEREVESINLSIIHNMGKGGGC